MTTPNVPADLPEWFRLASSHAAFSAKELAELFGFTSALNVTRGARAGTFPAPDIIIRARTGAIKFLWRKSTILRELKRRRIASLNSKRGIACKQNGSRTGEQQ